MATTKKAAAKPAAKKAAPKEPALDATPAKLLPASEMPKGNPSDVDNAALSVEPGDTHAVLQLDGKQFNLRGEIVDALRRAFEAAHQIVNPGR